MNTNVAMHAAQGNGEEVCWLDSEFEFMEPGFDSYTAGYEDLRNAFAVDGREVKLDGELTSLLEDERQLYIY